MNENRDGQRVAHGYNQIGGRPRLAVDEKAISDAVLGVWNGDGETITSVAARFKVSRTWIHKNIYPLLRNNPDVQAGNRKETLLYIPPV